MYYINVCFNSDESKLTINILIKYGQRKQNWKDLHDVCVFFVECNYTCRNMLHFPIDSKT
jgi:hypothetical protein